MATTWQLMIKQAGGSRSYGIVPITVTECLEAPTHETTDKVITAAQGALRFATGRMLGYEYFHSLIHPGSVGLEIGVDCGDGIRRLLTTECAHIHGVDTWIKSDDGDTWTDVPQNVMELRHQHCVDSFANERVTLHRMKSSEYLDNAAPNSLDWAYIDGCHYSDVVRTDMAGTDAALKSGGIMALDDAAGGRWHKEIAPIIDEFVATHDNYTVLNRLYDPWILKKL